MINKIKKIFNYNSMLLKNTFLKYEIVKLGNEIKTKDGTIGELNKSLDDEHNRAEKFRKAYRLALNEKENVIQQFKGFEKEIKMLRREVRRYEKAEIVFKGK